MTKCFSLKSERFLYFSPLLSNILLEILASAKDKRKKWKKFRLERKSLKLFLFTYDMIIYVENPIKSTKKKQPIIIEFSKVAG